MTQYAGAIHDQLKPTALKAKFERADQRAAASGLVPMATTGQRPDHVSA